LLIRAQISKQEDNIEIEEGTTSIGSYRTDFEQVVQQEIGIEIEEASYTNLWATLAQKSRNQAAINVWKRVTADRHDF